MRYFVRVAAAGLAVVVGAGAAGAASGKKAMLKPGDVPIPRVSAPHTATVIRNSTDASCGVGEGFEHDGLVVEFAVDSSDVNAANVREVLYEFDSDANASTFFDTLRTNDEARAECGSTLSEKVKPLGKGPKALGEARYTSASTINNANGPDFKQTWVNVLVGSDVVSIVVTNWPKKYPSAAALAKKAVKRLG